MAEDEMMDAADLRARNAANEQKLISIDARMSALEAWQRQMDIFHARRDEQFTNMIGRFADLEGKLDKLTGGISRLIWIIGTAVIGVAVTFVLKGGLDVP
ncbi:hypothetical protein [Rhizobium sp. GN54]|uniref:hypothetical protein n=1 Tax=Rhizobium sp. GN54 TaxID=2898150 RepID=UPI001E3C5B95|nr:hypothetical protein [Rhizobium sp. GN54]MCD2184201.1 hypothetical protein [Rhizobium sp. GN54]